MKAMPTLPRLCLKCGKSFASTGAGNRICGGCDKRNGYLNQPARCETQGSSIQTDERTYKEPEAPEASQ